MQESSERMHRSSGVPEYGGKGRSPIHRYLLCILLLAGCCTLFVAVSHAGNPSPYATDKIVGHKAPEFTLKDVNGNALSLSSFKGKVVLLHFWATWCPPCRDEIPDLNEFHKRLKGKGLAIFAVSADRAAIDVKDFMKKSPIHFPVVVDYDDTIAKNLYKVYMVPTTFLIDKKGTVVKVYYGEQEWTEPEIMKEVEALL